MTILARNTVVRRLYDDLIGPFEENEELNSFPSDVYLTGILWPKSTRMGAEDNDRLSPSCVSGDHGEGEIGVGEEEEVSRTGMTRPSTAGISFAISSKDAVPVLSLKINFATYRPIIEEDDGKQLQDIDSSPKKKVTKWKRQPINIEISDLHVINKENNKIKLEHEDIPSNVYLHWRIVPWKEHWLITLTIVNATQVGIDRELIEQNSLFQVRLEVFPKYGTKLVARPSRRIEADEYHNEEDISTSLMYRNSLEYAVGHTCSVEWEVDETEKTAKKVTTSWIPQKIVPSTSSAGHKIFSSLRREEGLQPLSALWLSRATNEELQKSLIGLSDAYNYWIDLQENKLNSLEDIYREQAVRNLNVCRRARDRIKEGATLIGQNSNMAEAFRLANQAMQLQYSWNLERQKQDSLIWRPFQLGFILLAAASVVDRKHKDRNTMDLLWFPTGGGKTEAYLALIAFLAFYRRLSDNENPDNGAGVAAVMRYTLRLLTTQQFSRAASMILACEAIRRGINGNKSGRADLGNIPFSVGIWVGGEATPNSFNDAEKAINGSSSLPSPEQLVNCPACRSKLLWSTDSGDKAILVHCNNQKCTLYAGKTPLPVFTVDENIYREKPTLLIGTVDKFAQIVRKTEVNNLFSISNGYPPDLIIQDELHLISGPLGTLAGLYEVAIDGMFTREGAGPKIIGSTATIRRATEQVRALFNRETFQFPPPAIDADDSGFAVRDINAPGRLYVGVTTAGRSAKFTLQAVTASLLQSANAGLKEKERDPYWTLIAYFNSLRELGGALVLMQDDVNNSIDIYANRRKESPRNTELIEELTSRRTQDNVRKMLDFLNIHANEEGVLDVVLATNMMSVGVDIPRLGLMIVNGQPKSTSEYIQATSRVGRGQVPGLVISVLNNAKPRDRSHYESFVTWHSILYRDVEPTSVTPFASRARDKALHAVLVALIRHLVPGMLNNPQAFSAEVMVEVEKIIDRIISRAAVIDPEEKNIETELYRLLEEWQRNNPEYYWWSYYPKKSLLQDAENVATLQALGRGRGRAWPTMNNLRNVEPSTRFRLVEKLKDSD